MYVVGDMLEITDGPWEKCKLLITEIKYKTYVADIIDDPVLEYHKNTNKPKKFYFRSDDKLDLVLIGGECSIEDCM